MSPAGPDVRSGTPWLSPLRDLVQTGLRLVPWPVEPGLRAVGTPGRDSPVLVTGNYDLTVRRLMHALEGLDAWVVVADSRGINVWCASSGGAFTTHQVVAALKTSGVAEKVSHRRAILPQLAATGVLAGDVSRRCGWKVRFGPVYTGQLARFLAQGQEKTGDMRTVRFGLVERFEMAAAWAVPMALIAAGLGALVSWRWSLAAAVLAMALALFVFLVYDRVPGPRRLILFAGAVAVGGAWAGLTGAGAGGMALAGALSGLLSLVLTFDYEGSTPVAGGSHFAERRWSITLDSDRCRGLFRCWEVCPEACFEKLEDRGKVALAHEDRCIRCGACVVQCPVDALFFEDQTGERIAPETVRRFKLDILGRREVAVERVGDRGSIQ